MNKIERFTTENFYSICDALQKKDVCLQSIVSQYGYPPYWIRPNVFETLVLTILEQQVSLESAYAAYKKLKQKIKITPENLVQLNDDDLRSCYFSRQKICYVRELAKAVIRKEINLSRFFYQPDDVVRLELKKLKGIGDWTVDIYLIHALRRTDIFPSGDLALVNAIKIVNRFPNASREEIIRMSKRWKPFRSVATMIFWHYYIQTKKIKLVQ